MTAPIASPIQNPRNSFPAWRLPNGIMNASDSQLDEASSSCELWEWGFAGLVVAAVVVEIIIAYIHPPYDSVLNEWGGTFADVAVALGIAGEIIFSRMDSRIQTEQRRRSNKELAEAKLELARVITPRCDVIAPHKEEIIEKLLPFEGTKFDVAHSKWGREEWDFLWWLEEIIEKGKWVFVDWNPGPLPHPGVFPKRNWTMRVHTYGATNVSDVVVQLDDENREKLLPAATALVDALNGIGIRASAPQRNINWNSATKDAVHILVGQKG
jgi:hypothetical protein